MKRSPRHIPPHTDPPAISTLVATPSDFRVDGYSHPDRRGLVSRCDTLSHAAKVAGLAEIIDSEPVEIRFVGVPPTAAPFRPIEVDEISRLEVLKSKLIEVEKERLRRRFKEDLRRQRNQVSKEIETEAHVKAEKARGLAEKESDVRGRFSAAHRARVYTNPPPLPTHTSTSAAAA